MSQPKHTLGPWVVVADGAGWYIECTPERGHSVAYINAAIGEIDPDTSDDEKEANARLIAAAPDLLEALKKAKDRIADMLRDDDGQAFKEARKALPEIDVSIAKATGQSK